MFLLFRMEEQMDNMVYVKVQLQEIISHNMKAV